jgi:hypothetical protein
MPHKTSKRRNGWGSLKRHIQRLVTLGFLLLGVFPTDVLTSIAVGIDVERALEGLAFAHAYARE